MDNIKTLYKLEIFLKTALHIGKGADSSTGASELLKDGNGDFFIPGTSIAGIFFDRLLDLNPKFKEENKDLWKKIQDDSKKGTEASSLVFRSSYFEKKESKKNNLIVKIRDRVRIDNERKVAVDRAKFSYWEIEPETIETKTVKFDINIEIDNLSKRNLTYDEPKGIDEYKDLEEYVENVFASWQKEGFSIGAFSASGNGWCGIEKVEKCVVNNDNFDTYLEGNYNFTPLDLNNTEFKPIYDTYDLTIDLKSNENDYGLNALLIAGGDSHISINDNDVDDVFINTGKRVFIPGSSVKGAFGFFMEKYGQNDKNNNLFKKWQKFLGQFEGDEENKTMGAGNFLVEDLFLLNTDNNNISNNLLAIERHKEDEFTRAIYGSGKFNEERLFNSTFKGKIRVRKTLNEDMDGKSTKKRDGIEYNDIEGLIHFLKQGMEYNLISLGANSAYPKFSLCQGGSDDCK